LTANTPPTRQATGIITGIYTDCPLTGVTRYTLEAEANGHRYEWSISDPAAYTVGTPITLEVPA